VGRGATRDTEPHITSKRRESREVKGETGDSGEDDRRETREERREESRGYIRMSSARTSNNKRDRSSKDEM
jgi:hypothetical protein